MPTNAARIYIEKCEVTVNLWHLIMQHTNFKLQVIDVFQSAKQWDLYNTSVMIIAYLKA